ncbi:MAG: lipopolysaccharide biosynthesis protein [Acidobacteria bacterium]|nr:MAG: lipopolysaccharide biosynthesis protein [Acidobacteriota bacterium]
MTIHMSQISTKPDLVVTSEPVLTGLGRPEYVSENEVLDSPLARLRLLWDQRRLLGRVMLIGLIVGSVIAFLIPKEYQSSVQLMPPDNGSSSSLLMAAMAARGATGGLGELAGGLLNPKTSGDLFVGILHSRTVEDRLAQRFDLKKVYGATLDEDARKQLSENTSISADRKSGILTVAVTDRDPRRAQLLGEGYVQELNHLVTDLSTSAAHRERVFLEDRLRAVKQDLDQAAIEFSQFASQNAAIDIKEQGKAMLEAAATVEGALIAAESEMKGLETIYTVNNARVRSVQARINELRKQLNDMGGKAGVVVPGSAGAADSLYPSIRQLPILGVTYADLYRKTKIQETVFETLTQQYELAKVQEAKETPSVKVLDAPNFPERKSFPPRILIIFLCACFALAAGAFWVIAHGQWQRIDAHNPRKIFVQDVFHVCNQAMPWSPPNGSRWQAATHRAWVRIVQRPKAVVD